MNLITQMEISPELALSQHLSKTFKKRLCDKIHVANSCWIWGSAFISGSFPVIARGNGSTVLVRRILWMIFNGEIPNEQYVVLNCPNKCYQCVNPSHLALDTCPNRTTEVFSYEFLISQGLNPKCITHEFLSAQGLSDCFPSRFITKFEKSDGCWPWIAGKTGMNKRGAISADTQENSRQIGASVASWILHRGVIPDGLWVLHDCPGGDNGLCVNPDHLWLGTNADNSRDRSMKRRSYCKLTWEQAQEIKKEWPNKTTRQIAKERGISKSAVWTIVSGKAYVHTPYDRIV